MPHPCPQCTSGTAHGVRGGRASCCPLWERRAPCESARTHAPPSAAAKVQPRLGYCPAPPAGAAGGGVCRRRRRVPPPAAPATAVWRCRRSRAFFSTSPFPPILFSFSSGWARTEPVSFCCCCWQIALLLCEIYCKRMLWKFLDDMRSLRGDEIRAATPRARRVALLAAPEGRRRRKEARACAPWCVRALPS